jgi:hypothetical protein
LKHLSKAFLGKHIKNIFKPSGNSSPLLLHDDDKAE